MLKGLWSRLKEAVGIIPKDTQDAIGAYLDEPFEGPQQKGTPIYPKEPGLISIPDTRHLSAQHQEELIASLNAMLRPRLVVDNGVVTVKQPLVMGVDHVQAYDHYKGSSQSYPKVEPDLLQPMKKRHLNLQWVLWYQGQYGCDDSVAWLAGASKMIDKEFQAKMRPNVEILPRDNVDLYLVKIKYHDPGKESL